MRPAIVTALSVPGEHDVPVWAGVATLVGVILALRAASAAYASEREGKPQRSHKEATAWMFGFAALIFASLGTAGGLWGIAGGAGWKFIIASIVIAFAVSKCIVRRKELRHQARKWRVWFRK